MYDKPLIKSLIRWERCLQFGFVICVLLSANGASHAIHYQSFTFFTINIILLVLNVILIHQGQENIIRFREMYNRPDLKGRRD